MEDSVHRTRRLPVHLAGLCCLTMTPGIWASGFSLPELSVAGLGLSNAIVANPAEPGAIAYNPAAMGFLSRSVVDAGALAINPGFQVTTSTGSHDSNGPPWLAAPMVQGAWRLDERWRLGLGVNAPFGLETKWKVGTFPELSAPIPIAPGVALPAGLQHPTQSKLEIVSLVPTAAYRVNDKFSFAIGADYYYANTARLNTGVVDIEGDGDGWGWNLSGLYSDGPWSFGASFHSASTVELDGDFQVNDARLIALGRRSQSAELDLNLPWRLQLGVRYAFNDRLAAEVDLTRTGWSEFEEIKVLSKSTGQVLTSDVNAWNDANAYRFGLTYQMLPQTQLRFGYSYDETGQPDRHFSARVPDSDRHLFSLGIAQDLGDGWGVEAGYMYVRFKDRSYRSDKPYVPGRDVNGTSAVNGDYEASAHLVGVSLRRAF
jgi:long-chain fatty acid transport protein